MVEYLSNSDGVLGRHEVYGNELNIREFTKTNNYKDLKVFDL